MRHFFIFLCFALTFFCSQSIQSKTHEPQSRLKHVLYHVGGGMLPGDHEYVELWRLKDGRMTLSLKGDCLNERLTFDVTDSVFTRCEQIIRETQLWTHKGTYDFPKDQVVLDAPKSEFTVSYEDKEETFWIDGNLVPKEARTAREVLIDYLKGLRGDRVAKGHIEIKTSSSEVPVGSQWTNRSFNWICEEAGIEELLKYLCEKYDEEYHMEEWRITDLNGSGFHGIWVQCNARGLEEILLSSETADHTILTDEEIHGRWPESARRLLTHKDFDHLADDSLLFMRDEILARYGQSMRDEQSKQYFRQQPWYKEEFWVRERTTDLEHINYEFLSAELRRRQRRASMVSE